jgi:hypothetical protein
MKRKEDPKAIKKYPSAAAAVEAAQRRGDKAITVKFDKPSTASKRVDGIAQRGRTKGKNV